MPKKEDLAWYQMREQMLNFLRDVSQNKECDNNVLAKCLYVFTMKNYIISYIAILKATKVLQNMRFH